MINEHVNRIENCPAVHPGTQDRSPPISPRSTPCRKSVPYWQKWVSPDELPCRDVKTPSTTRSLPRRTRDKVPSSPRPCVQKRKSCGKETEEPKKQRRESRGIEKCPAAERDQMPRSTSPCYNLPTTKPSYKPTRRQTEYRTSPTQSPTNDRVISYPCDKSGFNDTRKMSPVVVGKRGLSETVRRSPNDCKPSTDSSDKKSLPCRKHDTAISTEVPQASLYTKGPCHNKIPVFPPRDLINKSAPCNKQSDSQPMTEERPYEQIMPSLSRDKTGSHMVKPCRQMEPLKTRPQTTVLEAKPHSKCAQTDMTETFDLPKAIPCKQAAMATAPMTEIFDFPKELPCKQAAMVTAPTTEIFELPKELPCKQAPMVTAPTTEIFDLPKEIPCKETPMVTPRMSKKTHKPDKSSSQTQKSHISSEVKPCKDALEMEKRASSAERKCKNQPQTDDRTTDVDASVDEKSHIHTRVIHSTHVVEYVKLDNKCNQSKPAVSNVEKLRKSEALPANPPGKRTRQVIIEKPCDMLKTEPVISIKEKPCGQNIVEETRQNRRRKRRMRNEDKSSKEDSAIASTLIKDQTLLSKQKDCKQTSVLNTYERKSLTAEKAMSKQGTQAENVRISETRTTEKPCKNSKGTELLTKTAQEGTETKKNLMTEAHETKDPTSFSKEKPCKKNAAGKITPKEQLTEGRETKKNTMAESSTTQDTTTLSKEKPCRKNKALESGSETRPEALREDKITQNTETGFGKEKHRPLSVEKKPCSEKKMQQESLQAKEITEIDSGKHNVVTERSSLRDLIAQLPCKPKTEAKVPIHSDQATIYKTERCKDKPPLDATVQKQLTEKTAVQLASCADKNESENHFNTQEQRDEVQEPDKRCAIGINNSVISWMSQTSSLLSGQNEDSSSKLTLQEPCLSTTESTANKEVAQVIPAALQHVALPIHSAEYILDHEETGGSEEEEQSSAPYLPKSDADRCGCPSTETSKPPQKTNQGIPTMSEAKQVQETVIESRYQEGMNDDNKLTSTVQKPRPLPKKKCQHKSPSQTDDNDKANPVQNEMPDKQLVADKGPCPKSRMLTSDQSVESNTKLTRRCRQERILKLFRQTKKLPCKSALLPDSSQTLQSGSSGLSHYLSIDDEEQSDSKSNQEMKNLFRENEISDSKNNEQGQPYSHQSDSTRTKDPVLQRNIQDHNLLVVYDTDSPVEAEKLTERLDSADPNNAYSTKMTETAEYTQSFMADLDGTLTRKVQSDDHDVVTRRQNLSSEDVMHTSEPSVDVLDSWALSTESIKSTTKRKDSGIQPRGITKPLTLPKTVNEDLQTLLEWDSSDNTSSEANVPKKLDSNPKHQLDSDSSTSGRMVRKDSSKIPPVHNKQKRIPDKIEEDQDKSNSWDSTEETVSDTVSRPNIASHSVARKCCQDTENRDNSNSCDRRASDELDATDWSDSSSNKEYSVQPVHKTPANSVAKQYLIQKSSAAEVLTEYPKTKNAGLAHQAREPDDTDSSSRQEEYSGRFAPLSGNSRPSAVDNMNTWENLIASFKLDEK